MIHKILWVLLLIVVTKPTSYGQKSDYLIRNFSIGSQTKKDSAFKAIFFEENFFFSASEGAYYESFTCEKAVDSLHVEWPREYQIYQRNQENKAWVYINGRSLKTALDSVKVTAVPVDGGLGKTKTLPVESNGEFSGALELVGGDYDVLISEHTAGGQKISLPNNKNVKRVGVGEVLLAWGHSFMQSSYSIPATEARARTIYSPKEEHYLMPDFDILPIIYQPITKDVGPFNQETGMYGLLADTLVKKFNVPVLIYSSAFGGSNIYQNRCNITGQEFGYVWFANGVYQAIGYPYRQLKAALKRYVPFTGLRGMIVEHGINDYYNPDFATDLPFVIQQIRQDVGYDSLSILLAHEPANFLSVNSVIDQVINDDPFIYPGLDLRPDSRKGPWRNDDYGPLNGHFVGIYGVEKYFEFWVEGMPDVFFQSTKPLLAKIDNSLKTP